MKFFLLLFIWLGLLWVSDCQATIKGGLIVSTLKFTAIKNENCSLIFGNPPNEIRMSSYPDLGFVIETATAPLMKFTNDSHIEVEAPQMSVKSSLDVHGAFRVANVSQWRIVHTEDFTTKQAIGWDNKNTDLVTECAGIFMLGGYGKFSKGEVTKKISDLPAHDQIRITANFHFIDAWTGQTGFMRLNTGKDGSMVHVWTDRHSQDTEEFAVNVCGGGTGEGKFASPIEMVFPHSADTIVIGFGSTIESEDSTDLSWGVSALELLIR